MQKCINSDTSYAQSTPLWVFDAGAAYTTQTVQGGTVIIKNPVWDDQIFQNKINNFITALKNRYDTNSGLAYVDIRNVGNWGEWNEAPAYTEVQEHINMWNVFTNKQLFMINTTFDSSLWSGAQYALDTYHTGIRRDGCVYPDAPNAHLSLASSYDISPAVAEWWSSYSDLKNSGKWSPIMFERTLREGKPSYMGLAMWDSDTFYAEQKALADRWLNRVGYWFKMTKATYPSDLGNGTTGTVTFRMKNDGVAPIYPNKTNTGYVKLALLSSSDTVLATTTLSGINPFMWKPGQYKDESASFSFTYNASGTKLAIGVFTDNTLTNPDVKLGTGNGLASNWYVLSSMPQTESSNISSNKLYSASSEYGEAGYGYREARHAFDGDTNTRWVPNSNTAGDWLEVDFGESKSFSSVYLKENTAAITGYRIEYYNGTTWQTAYTGTTIGTTGTTVSFNPVNGSKARIYTTAVSASSNIEEFTVYSATIPIGQTIWLKAYNGNYASAWLNDANTPLQARATTPNTWEKFVVEDAGGGYVYLKALANNNYVSAWLNDANTPLEARATTPNTWEKFQWVDMGGGNIALKAAANNLYVSTWNDPNNPLQARASSVNGWEIFQWGQ